MLLRRTVARVLLLLLFGFTAAAGGCLSQRQDTPVQAEKEIATAATTIYPLFYFTEFIGGERVEVFSLLPAGVDSHHWEPTPGTIIALEDADLLVCNGAGMEPWLDKILPALDTDLVVVDTSRGIELLPAAGDDYKDGHGGHSHGSFDPHFWTDPLLALKQAEQIKDALVNLDPAGSEYYKHRFGELRERLQALHNKYETTLANLPRREIVVNHASFGYLAARYGLEQIALKGVHAEAEPTTAALTQIVERCRELGVTHIFVENLGSTRTMEALAQEVGAEILLLHPLGSLTAEEMEAGEDYFSLMERNLANLQIALGG